MSWGPESNMGQILRGLIATKDNWQDITDTINETFGTSYTFEGVRSAAYRQGLTLANREQRSDYEYHLRNRYATVGGSQAPTFRWKPDGREWVPFIPFGDLHVGAEEYLEEVFDVNLEFAREERALLAGVGDLLETAVPHHMPHTMWNQKCTPREQANYVHDKLYPFRNQIMELVPGNHEKRIHNISSTCPIETIAQRLGCLYSRHGGFIRIDLGTVTYDVILKHGHKGGKDYKREIFECAELYPEADVIAMGHLHVMAAFDTAQHFEMHEDTDDVHAETEHFSVSLGGLKRQAVYPLGIRTGHTLGYGGYIEDAQYRPTRPGFPVLWLNTVEKAIIPDVSGKFLVPR